MLNTEQQTISNEIISNVLKGHQMHYLTGDAGTGKTYTALETIKYMQTLPEFKQFTFIKCSPLSKLAKEIGGSTMQSVFAMGGKHILLDNKAYLPNIGNRQVVSVCANTFKKRLAQKNLQGRPLFVYIEEALVASSEELVAVKAILQSLQTPFFILAVGHPLQELRESSVVKRSSDVLWTQYETPSYLPARYDTNNTVHLEPSIFTPQPNWSVKKYMLEQNMRQGETTFGTLLTKCTKENVTDELVDLFIEQDTLDVAYKANLKSYIVENQIANAVYLTPSKLMQDKINAILSVGCTVFYPHIAFGQCAGLAKDFSTDKVTMLDNVVHTVPPKLLSSFKDVWEQLTVPVTNFLKVGSPIIFRQVYQTNDLKIPNGTTGTVISITGTIVKVQLTDTDTLVDVTYTHCHTPKYNGQYIYTVKVLPIMSQVAMTTSKVQGWTASPHQTVIVLVDGDNLNPKPHAYYVALSRATSIDSLKVVITTAKDEVDPIQVVNAMLNFQSTALAFHKSQDTLAARIAELQLKKMELTKKLALS